MSDISSGLTRDAKEFADLHRCRVLALEEERSILTLRLNQIKTGLLEANIAVRRLRDFNWKLGGDYQCPRCWVDRGAPAPLVPQPSDDDCDRFKCRVCDYELSS